VLKTNARFVFLLLLFYTDIIVKSYQDPEAEMHLAIFSKEFRTEKFPLK